MVEELRNARNSSANPVYLEFLQEFSQEKCQCYGFVEGFHDPHFYTSLIDNKLSEGWTIRLFPAGSKNKVEDIYSLFDWNRFDINQIVFFIDRDLSEILNIENKSKHNVYVTDGYSIENDMVNEYVCRRVISELYCFPMQESYEIATLFNQELLKFKEGMALVMAVLIFWHKSSIKAYIRDIDLCKLCKIVDRQIIFIGKEIDLIKSLFTEAKVEVQLIEIDEIKKIQSVFLEKNHSGKFIRGKFLIWFLFFFCEDVFKHSGELRTNKPPKKITTISLSNIMPLIASRCIIPQSLLDFINKTLVVYIRNVNS